MYTVNCLTGFFLIRVNQSKATTFFSTINKKKKRTCNLKEKEKETFSFNINLVN